MRPRNLPLACLALTLLGSTAAVAANDPSFARDLGATIALQGKPCDKVVSTKRNGDSDYVASCHDGNRYHVFVDPSGRVVVQKI
jgi:hypothetical protein